MTEREQPIQSDLHEIMNDIGKLLGQAVAPYGFALLVFPFGDGPKNRTNFISNADRADMITAMKELIAHMEGRWHKPEGQQ